MFSREPLANAANDWLVVSRRLRAGELTPDITQVCDLTCEFTTPRLIRRQVPYICYPILDAGGVFAAEPVELAKSLAPPKAGSTLMHRANGHGRTGMFAAIWLVTHGFAASADNAVARLQAARPRIRLRPRQRFGVVENALAFRGSGIPMHSANEPYGRMQ
jgi:protein-tyrosine phosphatase